MSGWYNRSKRFENLKLSANRLDTAASSLYPTKFALRNFAEQMLANDLILIYLILIRHLVQANNEV